MKLSNLMFHRTGRVVILFLILLLLAQGALAELDPWWNTSWSYKINNAIVDGVRPYQLSLNVSNSSGINNATHVFCSGNCNINFTDIRFTLDNTTALPYWIENSTTGKIWVNVTANSTVNVYYGNPNATTTSNINTTFITIIPDVVGAWDLNGDGIDRSGKNNNCEEVGDVTYSSDRNRLVGVFDGSSYLNCGNPAELQFSGTESFSISVKLNTSTTKVNYGIIGKWWNINTAGYTLNSYPNPGILTFVIQSSDGSQVDTTVNYNNSIWGSIIGSYEPNNLQIFMNGILNNTDTTTTIADAPTNFFIGSYISTTYGYVGKMSDVRVYNRKLNTAETTYISNNDGYVTIDYIGYELIKYYSISPPVWATWVVTPTSVYNTGYQYILANDTLTNTQLNNIWSPTWIIGWNSTSQKWESYKSGWNIRASRITNKGDAIGIKVTTNKSITPTYNATYNWTLVPGQNLIGLETSKTLSQINTSINTACEVDLIKYIDLETQTSYLYTCGQAGNASIQVNAGEGIWMNTTATKDIVRAW